MTARPLKLVVISYNNQARSGLATLVSQNRFTIGRGKANDWVLDDPEKHMSGRHCVIERSGEEMTVTDVSTNGVFVNGSDQPLGNGVSIPLNHGDRLTIGDYTIRVEVEGAPSAEGVASIPSFDDSASYAFDAVLKTPDDPFGASRHQGGSDPFGTRPNDRFGGSGSDPFGAAASHDPFGFPPSGGSPFSSGLDMAGDPMGQGGGSVLFPEAAAPIPARPESDHVAGIHSAFRAPQVQSAVIPMDWEASPAGSDPFGLSSVPAAPPVAAAPPRTAAPASPFAGAGQPADMAPSSIAAPRAPAAAGAPPPPGMIPMDADFLLGDIALEEPVTAQPPMGGLGGIPLAGGVTAGMTRPVPPQNVPAAPPTLTSPAASPFREAAEPPSAPPASPRIPDLAPAHGLPLKPGMIPDIDLLAGVDLPDAGIPAAPPALSPVIPSLLAESGLARDGFRPDAPPPPIEKIPDQAPFSIPEGAIPSGGLIPDLVMPAEEAIAPVPPPARPPAPAAVFPPSTIQAPAAPVARTGPAPDSNALVRAFLEGAGVHGVPDAADDAEQRMRAYGALFRELIGGLRDLLAARSVMKSEFRLEQTMIRGTGNNPLKFSVEIDQAVQALLAPRSAAYTAPLPAVTEAVDDLKSHQLGLIAAVQGAVKELLHALSPAEIQAHAHAEGLIASLVPGNRRAKYWETFEEAHKLISEQVGEDAESIFKKSFAQAYTKQVKNH